MRLQSLVAALLLALAHGKLDPDDHLTSTMQHDCWVPDYCEPETFKYKLCKLRLRGRKKTANDAEYVCPDGEYCEEIECGHQCHLPPWCECRADGAHEGRMFCCDKGCGKHPSTQWGLCRPEPTDAEHAAMEEDGEEDAPLPTGFHFWSQDELLYNSKLHIDEGHPYSRPRPPRAPMKQEL